MRAHPPFRVALQASAICLALLLACGCPAGGGEDGEEVLDQQCLDFAPDAALGSQTQVMAMSKGASSTCGKVAVAVSAKDLNRPLHTVTFSVVYDPAIVAFSSVSTAGSVLKSDGSNLLGTATDLGGEVEVTFARESLAGVPVAGTKLVMTLLFSKVAGSGNGEATFKNLQLFEPGPPGGGTLLIGGVSSIDGGFLIR